MLRRLLLVFTLVPAIELFLLLQIGSVLGPTTTLALILVTGLVGASLAKREGLGVLRELQTELAKGVPPGARLMEGVLVVIGGLLLVTPGVFTDVFGVLLILPPTRRWLAPRALNALMSRIDVQVAGPTAPWAAAEPTGAAPPPPRPRRERTPFSSPFDD